jgi:hypothetical protein
LCSIPNWLARNASESALVLSSNRLATNASRLSLVFNLNCRATNLFRFGAGLQPNWGRDECFRGWRLYSTPIGVASKAHGWRFAYPGKACNLFYNPVRVAARLMGVRSSNAVDTRHRFSNARSRSIKRPGWNRTMVLTTQPISLRRISICVLSNATSLTHPDLDHSPERQRRAHRIAMGGALRGTHGLHKYTTERCKCGTTRTGRKGSPEPSELGSDSVIPPTTRANGY